MSDELVSRLVNEVRKEGLGCARRVVRALAAMLDEEVPDGNYTHLDLLATAFRNFKDSRVFKVAHVSPKQVALVDPEGHILVLPRPDDFTPGVEEVRTYYDYTMSRQRIMPMHFDDWGT